jgi:hypothetical protein
MVMKVPSSSIIETSSVEISVLACFFGLAASFEV